MTGNPSQGAWLQAPLWTLSIMLIGGIENKLYAVVSKSIAVDAGYSPGKSISAQWVV